MTVHEMLNRMAELQRQGYGNAELEVDTGDVLMYKVLNAHPALVSVDADGNEDYDKTRVIVDTEF